MKTASAMILSGILLGAMLHAQDPLEKLSRNPKPKAPAPAAPKTPTPAPPPARSTAPPAGPRSAPASTGWTTFNSPSGFRVQHPAGWSFQNSVDATSKLPVIQGHGADARLSVLIMPVFENASTTPQNWINANLNRQLRAYFPGAASVRYAQTGQPGVAAASFDYSSRAGAVHASVLCWMSRGNGMVFALSAPANEFASRRAELVRILKSFQFTQAAAPARSGAARPAAPSVQWRAWNDPTEGAISMQVPAGWKVEGGVSRQFSVVAPVVAVRMTSPDGRIILGINDHNIPPYSMPGQMLREGTWYTPGYGTKMFVLRFMPGIQFAQFYAQNYLARGAQLNIRDRRDRPDLVEYQNRLNAQFASTGANVRDTSGEVAFEFNQGGQSMAGFVLATTSMTEMMGTGIWNAKGLYFYLAPLNQAAEAANIIGQALRTIKINPQWFYSNLKLTGDVSKIVSETNDYISKIQTESYWNTQRTQDRVNQNFDDYIRDVQRVRDPDTGQEYEARSGYNYYYIARGDDQPFGTDSTDVPRYIDVTPLEKVD